MPAEFTMRRRVQFAETDMAGVLHFSNYFRFMEELEHAFWRSLGLTGYLQDRRLHLCWPRVVTNCEYYSPLRFGDEVDLKLTVTKVGQTSLNYEVEFDLYGKRCALGQLTAVCCQTDDGEFTPTGIPPDIRTKLETGGNE